MPGQPAHVRTQVKVYVIHVVNFKSISYCPAYTLNRLCVRASISAHSLFAHVPKRFLKMRLIYLYNQSHNQLHVFIVCLCLRDQLQSV